MDWSDCLHGGGLDHRHRLFDRRLARYRRLPIKEGVRTAHPFILARSHYSDEQNHLLNFDIRQAKLHALLEHVFIFAMFGHGGYTEETTTT